MPAPPPRSTKIQAAYARLLGKSQADAGQEVNRHWHTILRWEKGDDWPDIVAEAQKIYLHKALAEARKAVIEQIRDGDGDLAFKLLERNEPGFEPPAQRHKLLVEQQEAAEIGEQVDSALGDMFERYQRTAESNGTAAHGTE